MKTLLLAIIISVAIFIGIQMVVPFPYGLIFGIGIPAVIVWRALKASSYADRDSLLSYRRVDPKTKEEIEQNKEAFRILKKRFLDGEITQEEYDRLKKDFDEEHY